MREHMSSLDLGISIPSGVNMTSMREVLNGVTNRTLVILQEAGCIHKNESAPLLAAYGEKLGAAAGLMPDFLNFTAEFQARKHSLTAEVELVRMQKVLRNSLNDRVHYWSFGPLSGRTAPLYEHCPSLRSVCMALGCPATLAGEASIVHVTSLNPVSALVASFWISQELSRTAEGDAPFIFAFFTDLAAWQALMQRHFAS